MRHFKNAWQKEAYYKKLGFTPAQIEKCLDLDCKPMEGCNRRMQEGSDES